MLTRGVDSVGSGFADPARVVKALARKRGELVTSLKLYGGQLTYFLAAAIVVLTGVQDYISDGETVLRVSNGHELVSLKPTYQRYAQLMLHVARSDHRLRLHDWYPRGHLLRRSAITPSSR